VGGAWSLRRRQSNRRQPSVEARSGSCLSATWCPGLGTFMLGVGPGAFELGADDRDGGLEHGVRRNRAHTSSTLKRFARARQPPPGLCDLHHRNDGCSSAASDDVRQALFQHLSSPDPCFQQYGPLSFSCELAAASERAGRRDALTAELRPACNISQRG